MGEERRREEEKGEGRSRRRGGGGGTFGEVLGEGLVGGVALQPEVTVVVPDLEVEAQQPGEAEEVEEERRR